MAETPTIRCPRLECNHPINIHSGDHGCRVLPCDCKVDPNTIAVAAIQTALFGELTNPNALQRVSRQPDGSWS